jgi:LysM repeat protein
MFTRILRRCAPLLGAASLAAAAFFFWGAGKATPAFSYGGYQSNVPNGDFLFANSAKFPGSNTCLLCHGWNASTPGQILPSSTAGYLASALRPLSAGAGWGGHSATAQADTDGDGFSNGEELQDPAGAWTPSSGTTNFGDQTFVSDPNWNQNYPPAPKISSVSGLASNQTVSGKIAVNVALRYAGLSRVDYTFSNASTTRTFSVAAPAATNYSAAYCLGSAAAQTGACPAWDSATLPDGVYAVTITAYDKRAASLGGPQAGTLQLSGVTIHNAASVPTATMVPPTNTPAPTHTLVPPTATAIVPPTATKVAPPTATAIVPPTATPVVPPTATPVVPPTATSVVPPAATAMVPPPASPVAPPCNGTSGTYVVQRGDNLYRIALRFGITVRELQRANNLWGSWIRAGQTLIIPGGCGPASAPKPTEGESEGHSGDDEHKPAPTESQSGDEQHKPDQTQSQLGDDQSKAAPTDDQAGSQWSDAQHRAHYTVKAGDNLFRIGLRYGVSVSALQAANGLSSIYISVGQVLVIP